MLPYLERATSDAESMYQYGFTKNVACNTAAVLLTEMTAEAFDTKQALPIIFMDASKAFDVVHHQGLLNILYEQGLTDDLWHLVNDTYTNITSLVKWNSILSPTFHEQQGIRQGFHLSAKLFKNRSAPLLNTVANHQDGFTIGTIKCSALMVADDLVMAANSPRGLQSMIDEAELDASNERYLFSATKTKYQIINASTSPTSTSPNLYNKPIARSPMERHIGIYRREDGRHSTTVNERIKSANRALYSLMGAGLHGLNGVNPLTASHLINIYVKPCLTYGLEALCLSDNDMAKLEGFYKKTLRQIQHLPQSTGPPACYLLVGA